MTTVTEIDVKDTVYLKWTENSWIVGPPGRPVKDIFKERDYRGPFGNDEVANELILDCEFRELSPKRLAELPKGSWFQLTYNQRTGARHLYCGLPIPPKFEGFIYLPQRL